MNLCPCGARGDPAVECSCSPGRLSAYREKLSRALLDRFDLVLTVPRARSGEVAGPGGEASVRVAERVEAAAARLRGGPPAQTAASKALLARAVDSLGLSARGHARVGRVAATIAALAGASEVAPEHVAEALVLPLAVGAFDRMTVPVVDRGRADYPPLLAQLHDPPKRLYLRGGAAPGVLAEPAVAVVGARSCVRVRRADRADARPRAERGRARRRERDGAWDRRRRASRRARRRRQDGRGARLRHRPRLPGPPRRARAADRRRRAHRLRVRARRRAGALALPGPQPDHRRSRARDGRGRGAGALRRAHHGRFRARARARGLRRAGRDHVGALGAERTG